VHVPPYKITREPPRAQAIEYGTYATWGYLGMLGKVGSVRGLSQRAVFDLDAAIHNTKRAGEEVIRRKRSCVKPRKLPDPARVQWVILMRMRRLVSGLDPGMVYCEWVRLGHSGTRPFRRSEYSVAPVSGKPQGPPVPFDDVEYDPTLRGVKYLIEYVVCSLGLVGRHRKTQFNRYLASCDCAPFMQGAMLEFQLCGVR
jgi:hypothetical protein